MHILTLKFGLLICGFYLAICALIDLAISLAARFHLVGMVGVRGWGFFIVFGIIWLMSFSAAFGVLAAITRAKFPH